MEIEEIRGQLGKYRDEGKKMFTTSSFQSHSLVMLHILSKMDSEIPVYFINTGYLFPDTVKFRDQVADEFGLTVIDVKSLTPKLMQTDDRGKFLFTSDPDYCCYLNKVQPLDTILVSHDIWINGIRADQSATRKAMRVEQPAPHGVTRFHPMLDWTSKKIYRYIKEHNLPKHPLDSQGYLSIGCEPCTRKPDPEMMEREARWYGLNKVECGLHTELVTK